MIERANNDLWKSQYLINPTSSRDPPTRTTKHPLYTALILESFFWSWVMFCVYDANTSVFILGTFFWSAAALHCRNKLENLPRTDKQTNRQTNKQRIQKQRPPYPLWSVDRRGTRANYIFCNCSKVKYWES